MSTKKLGFYSIILLTINSIIGTGIFLSPASVINKAGENALVVYLLAALFTSVLAITFASAAKYVSKGGASYAYAKAGFGENVGYYVGLTRYIAASIAWGVLGTGAVKTSLKILGFDESNMISITVGFVVLMGLLLLVNLFGPSLLAIISNISTLGKMIALIVTIIVGIAIVVLTGKNEFHTIKEITDASGKALGSNMSIAAWVTAIISAFYAFTGFESVASGSQDMENPEKNLPRAIPLAIGIIAIIYIGIVGVAMMINPKELVQTKEVVTLAAIFSSPFIRSFIIGGALVSMLGINVAASFHTPRIIESMAQQGQMPTVFAKRTKNGFPIISFFVTIIIAIIMPMAFKYSMSDIMIISSISRFVQFIVVPLAVILFFFGKQKEEVHEAKKSLVNDVIIPILAFCATILLLAKFEWVDRFVVKAADGTTSPNVLAIISMVLGYIVLPLGLMVWRHFNNKKNA